LGPNNNIVAFYNRDETPCISIPYYKPIKVFQEQYLSIFIINTRLPKFWALCHSKRIIFAQFIALLINKEGEDDTVHIFYVQCECFVYLQTFLSNG